jgi:hypothetical protein
MPPAFVLAALVADGLTWPHSANGVAPTIIALLGSFVHVLGIADLLPLALAGLAIAVGALGPHLGRRIQHHHHHRPARRITVLHANRFRPPEGGRRA